MRTAFISGGGGDIAIAIRAALELTGWRVSAPARTELDVTDAEQVTAWFNQFGPVDVVVNNAGTIHPSCVVDSNTKLWIRDIEVNLIAPYLVCKAALTLNPKSMLINIASTAGFAAYKDWSSYCAAKAGVITLTKSLAAEGANAFAISPGATRTKFRNYFDLPNDNMLEPSDVASVAIDVIAGKYTPGTNIFLRKGQLELR